MQYDVFISHASEDKDNFVRELATKLQKQRIEVWYDEFSLKIGDSLRRSIDIGLSKSRYGIVVLSHSFFKKKWTNWELDGLIQRQNESDDSLIIPIWHQIKKKDILEYSPSLADKVAIKSDNGIKYIVQQIDKIINPKGSTLIIARELLYKQKVNPPVITDDWWLDVLEYCGKEFLDHEYLSFSIPWKSYDPKDRGEFIGRHAMQMLWQQESDEKWISQLTDPIEVLNFIDSQPGLKKAAFNEPLILAFYLPQLTIRNFGGDFESLFENLFISGKKKKHECEEELALRHPQYGHYPDSQLACYYFTGAGGGIGPSTRRYDLIDCLIWLISSKSSWLPQDIKNHLFRGMVDWAAWEWNANNRNDSGFVSNTSTGFLLHSMLRAKKSAPKILTKEIQNDIKSRIRHSKKILKLDESVNNLFELFIENGIIDRWIIKHILRGKN